MNQHQLLGELFHRGVKVWADGDQLRVRAPQGALTPELRDSLAVHKQEILSLVCSSNIAHVLPMYPLSPLHGMAICPCPLASNASGTWLNCIPRARSITFPKPCASRGL